MNCDIIVWANVMVCVCDCIWLWMSRMMKFTIDFYTCYAFLEGNMKTEKSIEF